MRKLFCGLLAAILLAVTGCTVMERPEGILLRAKTRLQEEWQAEFLISVEDGSAELALFWSEQKQILRYTAPEAVEGLCFTQTASGLEVAKDGISQKLKAGQLLRSSVVEKILSSLEELSVCEGENLLMEAEFLLVDGEEADIYLRTDGSIEKILWEHGCAERKS